MNTLLFDLDGTLVNSMPGIWEGFYRFLDKYHVVCPEEVAQRATALSYPGIAKTFIDLGLPLSEEAALARMYADAVDAYANTIPAKNNVVSALRQLKARGYTLNVLSGSPHILVDPCLKRLGLWELMSNIWSCDDFQMTKSMPEIYQRVASALKIQPDNILFFDDNYHCIETAKQAGLRTCGVYDAFSSEYTSRIQTIADHYISDFTEVLTWI